MGMVTLPLLPSAGGCPDQHQVDSADLSTSVQEHVLCQHHSA